jgi:hypothetical protein
VLFSWIVSHPKPNASDSSSVDGSIVASGNPNGAHETSMNKKLLP